VQQQRLVQQQEKVLQQGMELQLGQQLHFVLVKQIQMQHRHMKLLQLLEQQLPVIEQPHLELVQTPLLELVPQLEIQQVSVLPSSSDQVQLLVELPLLLLVPFQLQPGQFQKGYLILLLLAFVQQLLVQFQEQLQFFLVG